MTDLTPQAIEHAAPVSRLDALEHQLSSQPATGGTPDTIADAEFGHAEDDVAAPSEHPARAAADRLIAQIGRAELLADVRIGAADKPNYDALPDEMQAEVDAAMKARRSALGGGGGK